MCISSVLFLDYVIHIVKIVKILSLFINFSNTYGFVRKFVEEFKTR